jgi:hypothetical protein
LSADSLGVRGARVVRPASNKQFPPPIRAAREFAAELRLAICGALTLTGCAATSDSSTTVERPQVTVASQSTRALDLIQKVKAGDEQALKELLKGANDGDPEFQLHAAEVEREVRRLPAPSQRELVGEWDMNTTGLGHCVEAIVRVPDEYIWMRDCEPVKPSCCEGEGFVLIPTSPTRFAQPALQAILEIQKDGSLVVTRTGFPTERLQVTPRERSMAVTWK